MSFSVLGCISARQSRSPRRYPPITAAQGARRTEVHNTAIEFAHSRGIVKDRVRAKALEPTDPSRNPAHTHQPCSVALRATVFVRHDKQYGVLRPGGSRRLVVGDADSCWT